MAGKVAKICGWVISIILLILVAGFIFIRLSPDYDMHIVRSQSMEPTIRMGDLAITRCIFSKIEPGMIVIYKYADKLVIHRVVSIEKDEFIAKGDAVEDPDPYPVCLTDVEGIYLFKIPYVGYVSSFISTKIGWLLVIILPAAVLVGFLVKDILEEAKRLKGGDA